jgi:L-methionine (R)-S-oxide reductase
LPRYALGMISREAADQIVAGLMGLGEQGASFRIAAMRAISELAGYDWSGIYRMEGGELVLDEFIGEPTTHTHIPVGVGVCGTAVKEDRNVLVDDVRTLDNYLSCSVQTRSEIVVLIRKGDTILGQIDIDGHTVGAFDKSDEEFLTRIAELIASRW